MTPESLQNLVEDLSLRYFNKPFKHKAVFNNRLRTTGGRYHLGTHNLDFNPKIFEIFGIDIFIGIIKHELCHYHLHLENKGYKHRDEDFKKLLTGVGGLRYTPSIEAQQGYAMKWIYQCRKCHLIIHRERRFNIKKFVCKNCKSHFELLRKEKIKLNS